MATEIAKKSRTDVAKSRENLVDPQQAAAPDADVFETQDQLRLILDVPGAEKGDVRIEVDENDTLQIRAKNGFQEPEGRSQREFEAADYYRSFYLGREYDKDAIQAKLENGVLDLTIPKREEVKPRRIQISA